MTFSGFSFPIFKVIGGGGVYGMGCRVKSSMVISLVELLERKGKGYMM